MSDPDPLPLDEVMAIVARRARRRQRLVLGGTLGAGAAALAIGVAVADRDPAPTAVVVGADGVTTSTEPAAPTSPASTPTTTPTTIPMPTADPPAWQAEAVTYALDTVGFDYDDAEALAGLWQVEPFTTKVVVGEAARQGTPTDVSRLAAGEAGADLAAAVQIELIDAFWAAGYDIGDAEEHGARWGTAVLDSKLLIGVRAANGHPIDDADP